MPRHIKFTLERRGVSCVAELLEKDAPRTCEAVWQAHRTHFYQRALDRGFTVSEVVARVFVVNLALVALAAMTVVYESEIVSLGAIATGIILVAWLLVIFAQGKT